MPKIILTVTLLLLSGSGLYSQTVNHGQEPITRVMFRLLPGYRIKVASTLEGGSVGAIWKPGGTRIDFELNIYASNPLESLSQQEMLWREEQTVGLNHFVCVYTQSNEIVIAVSGRYRANFRAPIRNQMDLTEVLLTVLTLDPEHGYSVDPSLVELDSSVHP